MAAAVWLIENGDAGRSSDDFAPEHVACRGPRGSHRRSHRGSGHTTGGAIRSDRLPAKFRRAFATADESSMAKRSITGFLRRRRKEKRHLSLGMRELMNSFEAQYNEPRKPRESKQTPSSDRASQDSP